MKQIILAGVLLGGIAANAQVSVQPYYDCNGVYHQGYERTAPNNTRLDNYSTKGNVNPFTGQEGTKNPFPTTQQPTYSAPAYRAPTCGLNANGQYVCR